MGNGYTYIWEFQVSPDSQAEFELRYGHDGDWVQLFQQASGFIETLLLKDRSNPGRYITIDRWQSEEDYTSFHREFAAQYAQLDSTCERLTLHEKMLGAFTE